MQYVLIRNTAKSGPLALSVSLKVLSQASPVNVSYFSIDKIVSLKGSEKYLSFLNKSQNLRVFLIRTYCVYIHPRNIARTLHPPWKLG